MIDKNLTDNETVKALECCITDTPCAKCGCPFYKKDVCGSDIKALEKYALDLINRQKAEIEALDRLNTNGCRLVAELYDAQEKTKAEAYKEFAERLDKEIDIGVFNSCYIRNKINNLLKELVGDK